MLSLMFTAFQRNQSFLPTMVLMMLLDCFFDLSVQITSQELNYRNSSTAEEMNY